MSTNLPHNSFVIKFLGITIFLLILLLCQIKNFAYVSPFFSREKQNFENNCSNTVENSKKLKSKVTTILKIAFFPGKFQLNLPGKLFC